MTTLRRTSRRRRTSWASAVIAPPEELAPTRPATGAISVMTLAELRAGVLLARTARARETRRRRLDQIRAVFASLPVDEPVAERYAELLAQARTERRTTKATDLLIIATAAATSRTLYTFDEVQAGLASAAGLEVMRARG